MFTYSRIIFFEGQKEGYQMSKENMNMLKPFACHYLYRGFVYIQNSMPYDGGTNQQIGL